MLYLSAITIALLSIVFFALSRNKAIASAGGSLAQLHSRPAYHGTYSLLWTLIVGFVLLLGVGIGWAELQQANLMAQIANALPDAPRIAHQLVLNDARAIADGRVASTTGPLREEIALLYASGESTRIWTTAFLAIAGAGAAGFLTLRKIDIHWRARNRSERMIAIILLGCAVVAILTTVGIVLALVGTTLDFFANIGWNVHKFLFGIHWSPLSGVSQGQLDPDRVGAIPLFAGTFMITIIAMLVAVPVGLFAAIYLSDFASNRTRAWAKPLLEVLAGVPTVVYGFFAAITVAPFVRDTGASLGLATSSSSALAAGMVMGIMIIPFISSLSDDVINSVPQSLRDGSYGLGATKAETIRQVVLPAALPGIVSAVLLGISRAVGETMIVVMAAGQGANLTWNPLEAVTTVTVQIVMLYTGDTDLQTASGPVFALGFTLFCVTLVLNFIALRIVRRYREMYD
ncbi:MAG: phosphate ABC transporter permease subunit PstC [Pseudomonadota bacterium]